MSTSDEEQYTSSEQECPPKQMIDRAVKCSYIQSMLGTVYVSLCGGMFVIGYALKLGANNVQIGLLSTIPMYCVLVQYISSLFVERGFSRKWLTILWTALSNLCWLAVIFLPNLSHSNKLRILIFLVIIAATAAFSHMTNNTRASWIGDLIPARERGHFFGKIMFFSGIIGALFSVIGGQFLDQAKNMGLMGFNFLFGFGMLFGLLTAVLYLPQADMPIIPHPHSDNHLKMILEVLKNGPLMMVTLYATVYSLQAIAAPFVTTYLLRDLKMPYTGLGIISGLATVMVLITSPFWGRVVDKYGCRPVLVATTAALTPITLVWIWMTTLTRVYIVVGLTNMLVGFIVAGTSVAMNTMIFKVTNSVGRSMQLAVYSIIVTLIAAPMPWIGGHIPGLIESLGIKTDVRCIFYIDILFFAIATLIARKIKEPDSLGTKQMVTELHSNIRKQE